MTLAQGISNSTLQGLLTGSLLAATTTVWLNSSNPFYLPVIATLWWLVIFGSNLLHAYLLSNHKFSNSKRFGMQVVHAVVVALAYWGIDVFFTTKKGIEVAAVEAPQQLLAGRGIPENVESLLSDTTIVVPAAFILSLVTSGLLFSILMHPSAKR